MADSLHALWPSGITGYIEPFVGGGSMLPGRPSDVAVAGDVIPELIGLWQAIQSRPVDVIAHYSSHWHARQARGAEVFYEVRARFNDRRDPLDLMFLSRQCVNGLIRFNKAGAFNNSLHHTRPGIHPDRLEPIVHAWSSALTGVTFRCADFRDTLADASASDAVFLDPPYRNTRGRYRSGTFEPAQLLETLEDLNRRGVPWMLTWDGVAGERSYDGGIPKDLYTQRLDLATGTSPFPRLLNARQDRIMESVYLGWAFKSGAVQGT